MSALDQVIPAEIKDDALFDAIVRIVSSKPVKHILEIGSSAGGGSTAAFVKGILLNPARPHLHCLELSKPRFAELQRAYQDHDFVKCHNYSSVPVSAFPTPDQVAQFYRSKKTKLNDTPLDEVLRWLAQDIDYIRMHDPIPDGIVRVRDELGIAHFDVVLIDGSEFTGEAELNLVYGAEWILLDDTNTYKNYAARRRLIEDSTYELLEDNKNLRNGFSVFRRVSKGESRSPAAWLRARLAWA